MLDKLVEMLRKEVSFGCEGDCDTCNRYKEMLVYAEQASMDFDRLQQDYEDLMNENATSRMM